MIMSRPHHFVHPNFKIDSDVDRVHKKDFLVYLDASMHLLRLEGCQLQDELFQKTAMSVFFERKEAAKLMLKKQHAADMRLKERKPKKKSKRKKSQSLLKYCLIKNAAAISGPPPLKKKEICEGTTESFLTDRLNKSEYSTDEHQNIPEVPHKKRKEFYTDAVENFCEDHSEKIEEVSTLAKANENNTKEHKVPQEVCFDIMKNFDMYHSSRMGDWIEYNNEIIIVTQLEEIPFCNDTGGNLLIDKDSNTPAKTLIEGYENITDTQQEELLSSEFSKLKIKNE